MKLIKGIFQIIQIVTLLFLLITLHIYFYFLSPPFKLIFAGRKVMVEKLESKVKEKEIVESDKEPLEQETIKNRNAG